MSRASHYVQCLSWLSYILIVPRCLEDVGVDVVGLIDSVHVSVLRCTVLTRLAFVQDTNLKVLGGRCVLAQQTQKETCCSSFPSSSFRICSWVDLHLQ
eukprot:1166351-Amphidinium_carterae.1